MIGKPSLTSTLNPLSLLLFYCYYFGYCSDELAACILTRMGRPHSTCHMSFAHNYCVELSNARINQFSDACFLLLYFLQNFFPVSVFLAFLNLPSFRTVFPNPGVDYPSGVMDLFFEGNDCLMSEKVIVNQFNFCQIALHLFKYIHIFTQYYWLFICSMR